MRWLDLSAHNARLALYQADDRTTHLIVAGVASGSQQWQELEALGFVASASGKTLIREGADLNSRALRQIFPRAAIADMEVSRVWIKAKAQTASQKSTRHDAEPRKRSADSDVRQLGVNHAGHPVFEVKSGRFYRYQGSQVYEDRSYIAAGATANERSARGAEWLRADDDTGLQFCADGFIQEMLGGRNMRQADLRLFAQAAFGAEKPLAASDTRLRQAQEAIEAAMQRELTRTADSATDEAFAHAVSLSDKQPVFTFRTSTSVENQQYSTPLPMSVAAQRILEPASGETVLEPTIGNASLVALFPADVAVTGIEIDPKRAEQTRFGSEVSGKPITVIEGDFVGIGQRGGKDYDRVIANPPFGGLQQSVVVEDLRCTRIDHLIAIKALQRRKADGRGVFIIAADRESLVHPGKIAGGSKAFFAWLSDHYELEDVVELNGALYRKQGSEYPVRMVTVGRRRTDAEASEALRTKEYRLGDTLPVLHTWDSLWSHAKALSDRLSQKAADVSQPAGAEPFDNDAKDARQVESEDVEAEALPAQAIDVTSDDGTKPDEAAEETAHSPKEENEYQAPYVPASQISEPTAMTPRNLLEPVRKALARLTDEIGESVDSYVARKLDFTPEDLEIAFTAEQVDAIALAIKRSEEGRGFILGDQTGQGKGRVLAGIARYAVLNGKAVTFCTEKANLFSDFWRDLKDIGTEDLFRPMILNADEPIRNMDTNKVEIKATKAGELQRIMDAKLSVRDAGYNIMFGTYSQFNREAVKSKKADWISDGVKGSVMILDESHVAAGDSNISDNIARAAEYCDAAIYSSATYAKGAKNMRAYRKVFPESVQVESLADTLAVGGEPLQEVLSAMLAEEGVFIRREHDLSKLEFRTVVASKNAADYESWADSLSAALREMAYFSGDVTRITKRMNKAIKKELEKLPEAARKGNRMGVSYQSFGSRLYNILRQFSLAIKVDDAAEAAANALREGRKPVLVVEQTFEALLKETLQQNDSPDPDSTDASMMGLGGDGTTIQRVTFRDVMRRVAAKLEYIYVRDDYGVGHYEHVLQQAENDEEREAIEEMLTSMRARIDDLPDLPVSPLDTVRERIQALGYSAGEISGRSFETRVDPTDRNRMIVTVRPDERLRTIQEFNNGTRDAVAITRAGATGLSLHASEKFADQRQREMIELQIANNVAERVQFFGRVNRRGQVCDPIITTLVSPLPSEARTLAMQNAKLRKLSANTQSNRNNQAEMRDVPDILNKVGNEICKRYLMENPDIAALLDIDPEEETPSDDEAYFANKLTGRIALLPVAKQRQAYADLSRGYAETLQEMAAKGINPFQTSVYDWGARIVEKTVFRPGTESGSVFDRPTYCARVEWEEEVIPLSAEVMRAAVARSRQHLVENDGRFELKENQYAVSEAHRWALAPEKLMADVNAAFDHVQKRALRSMTEFESVQAALQASESNPIKFSQLRRDWMRENLPRVMPGRLIRFTGEEDEAREGMVMHFDPPEEKEAAHLLGQYDVKVVVPGSATAITLTLNQLFGDPMYTPLAQLAPGQNDPFPAFDEAKPGRILFSRYVLMGNMFAAAQFAAQNRFGNAGIFVDDKGERHRAVIMYGRVTREDLESQPLALSKSQAAAIVERASAEGVNVLLVGDPALEPKNGVQLVFNGKDPERFQLVAPGTKTAGGSIYTNTALTALTGDFGGNRTWMAVDVPLYKLEPVIEALTGPCGQALYVAAGKAKRLLPQHGADAAAWSEEQAESAPSRPKMAA
uniref:strawberry notch C-terminal domain-containing protein n=1 Tax=Cupriavidus taiwanensis TaxID=164546 RepID=UPI003F4956A7